MCVCIRIRICISIYIAICTRIRNLGIFGPFGSDSRSEKKKKKRYYVFVSFGFLDLT